MSRSAQSHHAAENYSPLYFLASLGAGGLVVTFFMYLMFWVPHPGQPVPLFEDIVRYWGSANGFGQLATALAVVGISAFAILHYGLLVWNLRHLSRFKQTEKYDGLCQTNAESQMKAVPLTLAMGVNVGFILGLVFVPGLWSVVEYLFPLAMIAFGAIGIFAFAVLGKFLGRVMSGGGFDADANNSFAQLLPAFALSMVAVGFSAPAAMSSTPWIVGVSLVFSTFFVVAALLIAVIATVMAVTSILQKGAAPEGAPTLMIIVPIATVLGIAWLRQQHGLHTTFDLHGSRADNLMFLTSMLSIQILFAMLGMLVLRRQKYGDKFLSLSGQRSAGSYALVCPGVALSVMIHFWVNKGLVGSGLIAKFDVMYWVATTPALVLQAATVLLVLRLHKLHFSNAGAPMDAVPAE